MGVLRLITRTTRPKMTTTETDAKAYAADSVITRSTSYNR